MKWKIGQIIVFRFSDLPFNRFFKWGINRSCSGKSRFIKGNIFRMFGILILFQNYSFKGKIRKRRGINNYASTKAEF